MTQTLRAAIGRCLTFSVMAGMFLTASTVNAAPILVDADAFAAGTNISAAFPGVTLSAVGGGFSSGPSIFAVDPLAGAEPFTASTGRLVFGTDSASFPHLFREPGFLNMRVDFASPTNFVSIDYISNDAADTGFLRAFDSGNNLLGTYTTASLAANAFEAMTFSSGTSNIAYILAGGLNGSSSGGLDNLQYGEAVAAVPEPTSLLLLGTGALGALARRRKNAGTRR